MHFACTPCYPRRMSKPIQVRDVPDDVHEALTAKARRQGLSLSAYVRRLLERDARQASLSEVLDRSGGRTTGVSMEDVVAIIRLDRSRPA